jgi:hypothetical protein
MVQIEKAAIDLKFKVYYSHSLFHNTQKGMAHEYRKNSFLTSNGFLTHA